MYQGSRESGERGEEGGKEGKEERMNFNVREYENEYN